MSGIRDTMRLIVEVEKICAVSTDENDDDGYYIVKFESIT